jgi:phosphate uptake regulator
MKRRVIKQANQAYTITLPIEWVRENKISEKSELDVETSEKSLIISSGNHIKKKKATLKVSGLNFLEISRPLNALYAKGIDEIEIISENECSSKIIKSLTNTIGFALVSQEKNNYVIKDIGGGDYSDLDEIFKRVFQMILLFYESAIKDVFEGPQETIEGLYTRDAEINKFCLFLERAINKKSYPCETKGRALFTYAFEIEKIGDEIQRLWRTSLKYKIKKTKELKKILEMSSEGLALAFDFYYQFNLKIAEKLYDKREKVREDSMNLMKIDAATARFVRHTVKIIEEAVDLSHLTFMINLD